MVTEAGAGAEEVGTEAGATAPTWLQHFYSQWSQITADPEILHMIRGMDIELIDIPWQPFTPRPLNFSPEEVAATDHLIQELLDKNAIVPCEREPNDFVSRIFLRRKSNGSYRMILDLKDFNVFVAYHKFKMSTFKSMMLLVNEQSFLVSIDLSDAYLSFAMLPLSQRLLKFQWCHLLFRWTCMPFGLSKAPHCFSKALKAPLAVVRQKGFTIDSFLDDFLQCECDFDTCNRAVQFAYNLLVSLGFHPNFTKSSLVPSQQVESLGHIIDSVSMTVHLIPHKSEAIVAMCRAAVRNPIMSIRQLCCLIGKLISCFIAVPLGKLHYQSLEHLKNSALKTSHGNFDAKCTLNSLNIQDLLWWIEVLPSAVSPISRGCTSAVFTTDASDLGWGSCFNGRKAHTPFTPTEAQLSTNSQEILAVYYGLRSFVQDFKGKHILCMSDSTTAVSVIRKFGSMNSPVHDQLAKNIWEFAAQHGIWLSITHLAGRLNHDSDLASREFSTTTEWAVTQSIFDTLCHRFRAFGPFVIDLFASRLNYKIKPYYSWIPDPYSTHVDAFTISWSSPYSLFAHPPFSLWTKVVRKVI